MPTPASNPPLDPTPPPSYSFSTCPDDIQHSSHSSQPTRDEMTPGLESTPERRSQSPRGASSLDSDSQPSRRVMREESLLADDRISAEPSSRATTVSPRPRSSATAATSPPPETSSTKSRELLGASSLDQTAMSDEIMPVGVKPSGVESDESESELSDDNTQSSCFAGLEYSNKRVSTYRSSTPSCKINGISLYPSVRLLSCEQEPSSTVRNSQNAKSTTYKSKSNMSICGNHFYADIFVSKVNSITPSWHSTLRRWRRLYTWSLEAHTNDD